MDIGAVVVVVVVEVDVDEEDADDKNDEEVTFLEEVAPPSTRQLLLFEFEFVLLVLFINMRGSAVRRELCEWCLGWIFTAVEEDEEDEFDCVRTLSVVVLIDCEEV